MHTFYFFRSQSKLYLGMSFWQIQFRHIPQTQVESGYHFMYCSSDSFLFFFFSFLPASVYIAWLRGSAGSKNTDRRIL